MKDLQFNRSYHWGGTEIKVWHGKVEGVSVYFLDPQNGLAFLQISFKVFYTIHSSSLNGMKKLLHA